MTNTADLTAEPHSLVGLFRRAREHNLRLTIATVDGINTHGTPIQVYAAGDYPTVTLADGDEVHFVPLKQITKITPNPADIPVTVHTL